MPSAAVVAIYIGEKVAGPMTWVEEARAVSGRGLSGDRKYQHDGTSQAKRGPDRELTLIESEALEALGRDYQVALDPGESRRNVVTRGVPLNHLVGLEFRIGDVRLRGIRLCEPCSHLESLTRPGVMRGLVHRGGLRAQILSDGTIRVGDVVAVQD